MQPTVEKSVECELSVMPGPAESGGKRAQAFCPECGTPIYSSAVTDPQVFNLRVGTARQRAELRPKSQGWCRSARDWVMDLHSIRQFAKSRSS